MIMMHYNSRIIYQANFLFIWKFFSYTNQNDYLIMTYASTPHLQGKIEDIYVVLKLINSTCSHYRPSQLLYMKQKVVESSEIMYNCDDRSSY